MSSGSRPASAAAPRATLTCPGHAIRVGPDGERHPLGEAAGEAQHSRPRARHVERDLRLRHPIEEVEPAGEAVTVDGAAGEVRLHLRGQLDEAVDRHRLAAEVEQRGVAAADAEHEPPTRRLLHRRRDVGQQRGMSREGVGHRRGEPQPVRRCRGHRDCDERITDEVLGVGERDAVPTLLLGAHRLLHDGRRLRQAR